MVNQLRELSWTPRRSGPYYCSPACGSKCKIVDYDRADIQANELAALMGPGWTTDVWENMGWHYRAISPCRRIKIVPSVGGGYSAYLGRVDSAGGKWVEHGKTAKTAMRRVIATAKAELANLDATLNGL